jgi:hypothetical protein
MPWEIQREGSALRIKIDAPMGAQWEALMYEVHSNLKPIPKAVYLPARLPDGTRTDADMLKILWQSLNDLGVPILSPRQQRAGDAERASGRSDAPAQDDSATCRSACKR